MTRRDQIRSAYRLTGSNADFYDGMMTPRRKHGPSAWQRRRKPLQEAYDD